MRPPARSMTVPGSAGYARRRAKLKQAELEYYPQQKHFLEMLLSGAALHKPGADAAAANMLDRLLAGDRRLFSTHLRMMKRLGKTRVWALAPYSVEIK